MEPALWVAKTGLDAQNTRMQVIAHNLANVNTTGFKRDRASFEDLLYQTVRQPGAASSQRHWHENEDELDELPEEDVEKEDWDE